ncbi:MAG: hypothetical protein H7175_18860, partial [Burkholderiales bacterium]|nr:hypothetical protein [Anaerolineae bacterium]
AMNIAEEQVAYIIPVRGEGPFYLNGSFNSSVDRNVIMLTVVDLSATIRAQTASNISLSRRANANGGNFATVSAGDRVDAVSRNEDGSWIMVLTGSRLLGWLPASSITATDSAADFASLPVNSFDGTVTEILFPNDKTTCTVLYNEGVNLRSGPGEQYPSTGVSEFNYDTDVIARSGNWYLLYSGVWINRGVVYDSTGNCDRVPQVTLTPEGNIVLVESPLSTPPAAEETDTDTGETTTITTTSASECVVLANAGTNRRSGPATTFESPGKLTEAQTVTGQTVAADGTWYQLADGSWVRSDVVATEGDCTALPSL